tara:strand:+ start:214 stop:585 length:372 start_codon:yes stop_codon:yes gene_type:complete
MATLTPTLTLASSDMNGDVLNLSVSDSLTIRGQITTKQVAVSTSSAIFATAANYTKSWVYLKNLSSVPAELITIEKADGGDEYMELGIGEFAWFPWKSEVDLFADSAVGTPTLEVRIYQETAA